MYRSEWNVRAPCMAMRLGACVHANELEDGPVAMESIFIMPGLVACE